MDSMNTTDGKAEPRLSAEEIRTLLAIIEARERGDKCPETSKQKD